MDIIYPNSATETEIIIYQRFTNFKLKRNEGIHNSNSFRTLQLIKHDIPIQYLK
jgi:hypothetical protein